MDTLLGLVMIVAQVFGTIIVFGGAKTSPKWLTITTGVLMCFFLLAMFGLATEAGY